ncbi:DUF4386 domain-containing protein [Propionivibrio sp.]|uniref:DUF4386 domain-containing protein n=1 Tax=Propionivibrio sp. TaxID=2212460 RepID=UPI0026337343|nr:DUF4386 domain-containing protein [Propionivibrio sp.]
MDQIKSHARHAGLLYLSLALIAPFSLSYVPSVLSAAGGVSAATISKHQMLLQFSVTSELVYQLLEIYIVLSLYALFRGVDRRLALQMLILGLLPIPIVFLNELTAIGSMMVANGLGPLGPAAQNMTAVFFHDLHQRGLVLASIFWGFWLFPLGRLIRASNFLPNLLGWSVIIGGLGYVVRAIVVLGPHGLYPDAATGLATSVAEVMILGEVPIIAGLLWLGFRRTESAKAQLQRG